MKALILCGEVNLINLISFDRQPYNVYIIFSYKWEIYSTMIGDILVMLEEKHYGFPHLS